jgi:hypothetical protein
MPSKSKKLKSAVPFNPADVANITKAYPYIQRLIEDASLRENVQQAIDSSKKAYGRLSNGKAPQKALLEDKKLQADIRRVYESVRDASSALQEAPKKKPRKARRFGRRLFVLAVGGGLALAGSEKLRSKVLDTLFGAEEEFEYTPPATAAPPPPATPVSSS